MLVDEINARESDLILQEVYRNDRWKMMIGCILLNQTTRAQVDTVRHQLFETYPDALAMAEANPDIVAEIIRPCGLQNRRTKSIINFSNAWINWEPETPIIKYPGIGTYAEDSWNIFVDGKLDMYIEWIEGKPDIQVGDKELKKYLKRMFTTNCSIIYRTLNKRNEHERTNMVSRM